MIDLSCNGDQHSSNTQHPIYQFSSLTRPEYNIYVWGIEENSWGFDQALIYRCSLAFGFFMLEFWMHMKGSIRCKHRAYSHWKRQGAECSDILYVLHRTSDRSIYRPYKCIASPCRFPYEQTYIYAYVGVQTNIECC